MSHKTKALIAVVGLTASAALVIPIVAAVASSADEPTKQDRLSAVQAAISSARTSAAPKKGLTAPQVAAVPTALAPETGFHLGTSPLPTAEFVGVNSYTGKTNGTYFSVFAGSDEHAATGAAPTAAVAVYADPSNVNTGGIKLVGVYDDAQLKAPLKIQSANGGDLVLTASDGTTTTFDVTTDSFK